MPFDGLGSHSSQSSNSRLLAACRNVGDALALMWPPGLAARRAEAMSLRKSIEPVAVPALLCAARTLIASEEKWAKGRLRTHDGRFCAMGAVLQVSALGPGRHFRKPAFAYLRAVARQRNFSTVEAMNDCSTHAEVLAAFDEAIRLAEADCVPAA
ncbi:MAG TPA: hypothetical protein VJ779_03675 [Acetobacteraceae bacterium]|nr:hypothetical protein [Acetobacteraceae bacterium]